MGVAVSNDGTEQPSHYGSRPPIQRNYWKQGSKSPSQVFGNNALPNLKRLSLSEYIGNDGYIALVSAKQNTSLLQLDCVSMVCERVILALASLPEIKVLKAS
jgi:hypothetical protein